MIIGVPKEIKDSERRVGMTPTGVDELVARGHRVLIEAGAGAGSGFSDDTYRAATAYATSIGFLAYAGYRAKWESFTLYFDLGGGWQFVSATADNGYTISKSGRLIDGNLGLGIPF